MEYKDNYIALAIAILKKKTNVDEILFSMKLFDIRVSRAQLDRYFVEDVLILKQSGMTMNEIIDISGLSRQTVYTKLEKYQKEFKP